MTTTPTSAREALEPFAKYAEAVLRRRDGAQDEPVPDDRLVFGIDGQHITIGDLRRACSTLANLTPEPAAGEVTQADREAAADLVRKQRKGREYALQFLRGTHDNGHIVQAFRAHRLHAAEAIKQVPRGHAHDVMNPKSGSISVKSEGTLYNASSPVAEPVGEAQ